MRKFQKPPMREPMLDSRGGLTPLWVRWFEDLSKVYDDVRRPPDRSLSASATLTADDYGKIIQFDTTDGNLICTLPTARAIDIDCWMTIFRAGSNRLTIVADSEARIEYSSYGGRTWCDEKLRAAANLTLQLVSATQWGVTGATGIWYIR